MNWLAIAWAIELEAEFNMNHQPMTRRGWANYYSDVG